MRYTYLVLRGNLYYFQCRVPSDIKHYFPGIQIRKSLKTDNRKHALTLVKGLIAKSASIINGSVLLVPQRRADESGITSLIKIKERT